MARELYAMISMADYPPHLTSGLETELTIDYEGHSRVV